MAYLLTYGINNIYDVVAGFLKVGNEIHIVNTGLIFLTMPAVTTPTSAIPAILIMSSSIVHLYSPVSVL